MRMILSGILSILMLSLSQMSCGSGPALSIQERRAILQEHPSSEEGNHCCQGVEKEGATDSHCPPSCHCACCHSPAVTMVVKHQLSSFSPEMVEPAPVFMFYHYDFHHLIWHPPQIG